MVPRRPPPSPPAPPPGLSAGPRLAPGQLLLIYSPDGPLGGTFICPACRAHAWQPDLLEHGPACPQRHPARG